MAEVLVFIEDDEWYPVHVLADEVYGERVVIVDEDRVERWKQATQASDEAQRDMAEAQRTCAARFRDPSTWPSAAQR